jgi:hypothetical protein
VSSAPTARLVAAALVLATMLGGFFGIPMLVGVVALFAPTASSLAAVAAVTLGQVGIALASGERGMLGELGAPYGTFALAAAVPLALWAAWMAWRWRRTPPSGESPHAKRWSRALYAVLALGALFSGSDLVFGGVSSPSALLGDGDVARSAVALCGLGAALLVLRGRAWRLAGTGALAIGATGVVAGLMGERWVSDASAISWTTGRLSLVASVPIGREVNEVALSPNGTRYLTRRWIGDDEDESGTYARQIVTGRISAAGATRTFTALDAVLPTEGEVLVLARVAGDSLELRLERADADSASRVVWRRTLPALVDAHLQLDAHRARWVVRGRLADRAHPRLATVSGAIDGADVRQADVPADSLRGQVVYSYGDGASLVIGMTPRRADDFTRGSVVATYLSVLRGNALTWTLWRFEQGGSRAVKQLHGYPTCASSMEDDVAICVEQGRGATHVWRVARDSLADLGSLARRYDRATASQGGTVVASSYQGNAIAIVDATRRRGVRTTLPTGEHSYVREVSATDSTVLALLGSAQGLRLVVYRLTPSAAAGRIATR